MYVKVGFGLQPKGLVQVPAAALIFRATGPQVARVDKSGRINFSDVTIARDDGNATPAESRAWAFNKYRGHLCVTAAGSHSPTAPAGSFGEASR